MIWLSIEDREAVSEKKAVINSRYTGVSGLVSIGSKNEQYTMKDWMSVIKQEKKIPGTSWGRGRVGDVLNI